MFTDDLESWVPSKHQLSTQTITTPQPQSDIELSTSSSPLTDTEDKDKDQAGDGIEDENENEAEFNNQNVGEDIEMEDSQTLIKMNPKKRKSSARTPKSSPITRKRTKDKDTTYQPSNPQKKLTAKGAGSQQPSNISQNPQGE